MKPPSGTTRSETAPKNSERQASPDKEVSYGGNIYDTVKEGLAEILVPRRASKSGNGVGDGKPKSGRGNENPQQSVFYNPIQQFNRDLSVLAIRAFADDLAAVRLAKRKRREERAPQAPNRGKKRKRKADDDTSKQTQTVENGISVQTARGSSKKAPDTKESLIEVPPDNAGVLVVEAGEEGKYVDEPKEMQEDGKAHDEDADILNGNLAEVHTGDEAERIVPETKNVHAAQEHSPKKKDFIPPFRILDALSASGLRALRYAKEIPMTTSVTANDLSSSAAEAIKLNVTHNDLTSRVQVNTSDAIDHMHSTRTRTANRMPSSYHVIDLDPYGTAAPFFDAAVRAISDGGLLCVTCTDAGVFASKGYAEKTYSQYGGLPLKGPHSHEAGLRLILHAIATSAARYGMAIEPLLSLSIDFYARIFVRLHHSPADVKFLVSKTMIVYQCDEGCGSWTTQFMAHAKRSENRNGEIFYNFTGALGPSAGKKCEHCGFKTHLAGPMWGGALHNTFFVQRILDMIPDLDRETYPTIPRVEGMLTLALDEDLEDPWTSAVPTKNQFLTKTLPTDDESRPLATEKMGPSGAPRTDDEDKTKSHFDRPVPPLPVHYRTRYPFFVHPPSLARVLASTTPPDASLRGALRHLGYLTTRSHAKAGSIVTNAPFQVVWEIMREWNRQWREKQTKFQGSATTSQLNRKTAGAGIMKMDRSNHSFTSFQDEVRERIEQASGAQELKSELQAALYRLDNPGQSDSTKPTSTATTTEDGSKVTKFPTNPSPTPPKTQVPTSNSVPSAQLLELAASNLHTLDVRFDERLGKDPRPAGLGKRAKMIRYQANPRENWGPMVKAKNQSSG